MSESKRNRNPHDLEISSSDSRRRHALVISGIFGLSGVFSFLIGPTYVPNNMLVGMVCLIITILIYSISRRSLNKTVVMTINGNGIWYKDWKLPVIPWNHIGLAYSTGIRIRPLLRINLVDAEVFFSKLDKTSLKKLKNHPLIKSDHLLVPNSVMELSILEISNKINSTAKKIIANEKFS